METLRKRPLTLCVHIASAAHRLSHFLDSSHTYMVLIVNLGLNTVIIRGKILSNRSGIPVSTKSAPRRNTMLIIMDGFGVNPSKKNNAVVEANTPN